MQYRHLAGISLTCLVLLLGCSQPDPRNLSIEGIWTGTPETALDYPESNLINALLIEEGEDGSIEARGCFMWDGSYHHTWELVEVAYSDSLRILSLLDGEGDRYEGTLDADLQVIHGYIWSGDPGQNTPVDTVDFIRADPELAQTLFFPRTPDSNGEALYVYEAPKIIDDGLLTAHINATTGDSLALFTLLTEIIAQDYGRLESLLVMKDSTLVLEEYFYGYDRTQHHNIHSVTKSIASLQLGIVMEQHEEVQLTTPLFDFFPEYDSLARDGKEQVTLEHLLNMTAGLPVDDIPGWIDLDNQLLNILSRPLAEVPGEVFQYNNDNSILLGGILQNITGEPADQLVKKFLFDPMGIRSYQWSYVYGLPQCHSDLQMLPRDMVKIGQLVLNDGRWGDLQLVPKEWILKSTRPHLAESEYFDYAYHWWHRSVSNKPWWDLPENGSNEEHEIVIALGFGGQYIMVIRDLNMVAVCTSSDYADGHMARSKIPMVIEKLIPLFD
jgi:CubicO group peptidase (beta-lactamase class C family)